MQLLNMKIFKKRKCVASFFSLLLLTLATQLVTKKRRYSVRPLNRQRKHLGHFNNLVQFMKLNDREQYFKYTRYTPEMFDHLLGIIQDDLQRNSHRPHAISPAQRLTMTLHYLSEGCSMQEIAWNFYIGKSTAHYVIKETCNVLWNRLSPIYLEAPNLERFCEIAQEYFLRWNMPNCLGAIDGKHIAIQAPEHSGSEFHNYKHGFSIVLMACCDAYYNFTLVDIGASGSCHDSIVFGNSEFGKAILNREHGKLNIPQARNLPNSDKMLPYFFVADQAFPLSQNIMRPYAGANLGQTKNVFNYRLARARRTIENTFGILAQRWRIFRKPIIAKTETAEAIVKATVVLHNFAQKNEKDIPQNERRYCPTGMVDYEDNDGNVIPGEWRTAGLHNVLQPLGRIGANNSAHMIKEQRNTLAEYFDSNEGAVPWQLKHVMRGSVPDM